MGEVESEAEAKREPLRQGRYYGFLVDRWLPGKDESYVEVSQTLARIEEKSCSLSERNEGETVEVWTPPNKRVEDVQMRDGSCHVERRKKKEKSKPNRKS